MCGLVHRHIVTSTHAYGPVWTSTTERSLRHSHTQARATQSTNSTGYHARVAVRLPVWCTSPIERKAMREWEAGSAGCTFSLFPQNANHTAPAGARLC